MMHVKKKTPVVDEAKKGNTVMLPPMHYARGGRMKKSPAMSSMERVPGDEPTPRMDRPNRAGGGRQWIAAAAKNKGALHRALHVPEGEKIPAKKLKKAEHSSDPTMAKRARLAETLKGFRK